MKRQWGIPSSTRQVSLQSSSKLPKLHEWLAKLDANDSSDEDSASDHGREQHLDLYEPLRANGIRKVHDIPCHSSEDIIKYTQCSIGMAARVREMAEIELKKST
jgi:hypothetical protein